MANSARTGIQSNPWLLGCATIFCVGLVIDSYLRDAAWISVPPLFVGSGGSLMMMAGLLGGGFVGGRMLLRSARTTD